MRIYSELKYIFFDELFDLNENISIVKVIDHTNRFSFSSDKLGSFEVEFSIIENKYGMSYNSETKFESIFLNGSNLKTPTPVNGQLYMRDNAIETIISSSDTFYKVLGTSIPSFDNYKYIHSNNRLTNDDYISGKYLLHCNLSFNSGNNHVCEFGFYDSNLAGVRTPSKTKSTSNGSGKAENISFTCVVSHSIGDYIEVWCSNKTSAQNITVTDMNLIISEIK